MEWKKQALAIGVTAAAIFALSTVSASANNASAGCNAGGHNGNGVTQWYNSGTQNKVSRFDFQIGGSGTGGKSNTNIRHFENRKFATDRQLYSWNSADAIKQNTPYSHTPTVPISIDFTKPMYTKYEFIFDTAGNDPTCTARTSDFD